MADRFDADEWLDALADAGLSVRASERWGSWLVWSVAG
jgi:hypothetical protein